MSWKNASMRLTLAIALLATLMISSPISVKASTQMGPRAPGLDINFYTSNEAAFSALLAGEIEYMGMLTKLQFDTAKTRPDIITYPEITYSMIDEAFMSNYTCITDQATYPGVRNPINSIQLRKAIMHLADKATWIDVIYEGFASRIDVPICAPTSSWWNPSITGANYPYVFKVSDALAHLEGGTCSKHGYIAPADSAGFIDHDGDGIRNYPIGWPGAPLLTSGPGAGKPVNVLPLQYWIYNDPPEREAVARSLGGYIANELDIPVTYHVASYDVVMEQCWCLYDYHLCTDGWSLGRYPTYLWFLFASYLWIPEACGPNAYTGGDDEPWAAEIDAAVEGIQFAPDSATARANCLDAQYLIIEKYALMLPTHSDKGFYAYRDLVGGSKFYGGGFFNDYTLLKAQRASNPALNIRMGVDIPPPSLNTIHCMWAVGYTVMAQSWWTPDPVMLNPIDPMIEQAGKERDWEPITWVDGTTTKSKVTHWLTKEASWIEPKTGNVLDPLTTAGYEFGAWMMYQTPEAWWHADYKYIHHIRLDPADTSKLEIWFDRLGWLFYLDSMSTNFGIYAVREGEGFKQSPIATKETKVFVEGVSAITPGDLSLPWRTIGAPIEIVSIKQDGVPLTRSSIGSDNDYEIVKGRIHIYKDIPDGASIEVTYWAKGDTSGYTAGGLPWEEVMTGTGAWYMTYFDRTMGASFAANRNHQLETPPVGETDWYWNWIAGSKPRDGYMEVSLYDTVLIFGCFDSQGRYVPDPHWNPTADVAPEVGLINIYDAGTAMTEYSLGTKFWSPLPNPPP